MNINDSTAGIPDVNKICSVEMKSIFSVRESTPSPAVFLDFASFASEIWVGTSPIFLMISLASFRFEAVTSPFITSFPAFNA